jgi:hypothetical protein
MTSRFGLVFATTLSAAIVAPILARAADILPPPYDGSAPPAKIATDAQALSVLHQRGVAHVSSLGRVGDYWEGEGLLAGRPVIAYVFVDGALTIHPAAPGDRIRTQSAELPE